MFKLTAVTALAASILSLTAGTAAAVQLESADRDVTRVRVTYVEPIGARKLYVELNNGATYRLNPCRYEDGRNCYWDARTAGNGRGHSFVAVSGRLVYSNMIGGMR